MSPRGIRVGCTRVGNGEGLTSAYVEDRPEGIGTEKGFLDFTAALIHRRRHKGPHIGEKNSLEFARVEYQTRLREDSAKSWN